MTQSSLVGVLRERASLQPDDLAYTYLNYEIDPDGVAISLTWPSCTGGCTAWPGNFARSPRSANAPSSSRRRGLEYVVAFLATLQAGLIGSRCRHQGGRHDERIAAVIADSARPCCSPRRPSPNR